VVRSGRQDALTLVPGLAVEQQAARPDDDVSGDRRAQAEQRRDVEDA
jgi:hypothetical protein